jgi:RNA:NAD 2'-phosphotransferase (TPT1/KptA family)
MGKKKIKRQEMGKWLYHATTKEHVETIRDQGLQVSAKTGIICLSVAYTSAWPMGRGVRHLFRVKVEDVEIDKRMGMTEVRTKEPILASKLEYCTGQPNVNTDWEPA